MIFPKPFHPRLQANEAGDDVEFRTKTDRGTVTVLQKSPLFHNFNNTFEDFLAETFALSAFLRTFATEAVLKQQIR